MSEYMLNNSLLEHIQDAKRERKRKHDCSRTTSSIGLKSEWLEDVQLPGLILREENLDALSGENQNVRCYTCWSDAPDARRLYVLFMILKFVYSKNKMHTI